MENANKCNLCKKELKKPWISKEGFCCSCSQRRRYFPNWEPNFQIGKIDYENFELYDLNNNRLPKKTIILDCLGLCGHLFKTNCHKEHTKFKKHGYAWKCASCSIKDMWEDPKYREKHEQSLKEGHNKPESKKNHSVASKNNFKNPEFVLKHREYSGYKSCKKEYYDGILFRSSWEIELVKCLNDLEIKWEYEKEYFSLPSLNGQGYIPDFYLPDYDIFLEVKGWYHDYAKLKFETFKNDYKKSAILIGKENYKKIVKNKIYIKELINETCKERNCSTIKESL